MKVLFCGLKYEYGNPKEGFSFEYRNFFEVLSNMEGVAAEGFFIDEQILQLGRDKMNSLLIQTVLETKPDLLFTFLFTEELKKETIDYITRTTKTKTFNWFTDDHWRFPVYSKYWAPLFTAVSTTDSKAVKKYRSIGVNVIKTQWGANTRLYKPAGKSDISENQKIGNYDITFVGKNYGKRSSYINALKSAGLKAGSSAEALVKVEAYGSGWKNGRLEFEEMLKIFSTSKINLNFTESPYSTFKERVKFLAKFFIQKELGKFKLNIQYPISNIQCFIGAQRRQIKGRTFEVPACGGFLLTANADNLRDYYEDGKEIAIFNSTGEMVEKAKYYLAHEQERQNIAKAGYERTIKEHTYELRFREIFKKMQLI